VTLSKLETRNLKLAEHQPDRTWLNSWRRWVKNDQSDPILCYTNS